MSVLEHNPERDPLDPVTWDDYIADQKKRDNKRIKSLERANRELRQQLEEAIEMLISKRGRGQMQEKTRSVLPGEDDVYYNHTLGDYEVRPQGTAVAGTRGEELLGPIRVRGSGIRCDVEFLRDNYPF